MQADGKTLYLDQLSLDQIEVLDSAKLDVNGAFTFTSESPTGCFDFYRLRIDDKVINLTVDSTEAITVEASLPVMQTAYTVSGSESSIKIKELVMRQIGFAQEIRRVNLQYGSSNPSMRNAQIEEMVSLFKSELTTDFIMPDPSAPCAYYALFTSVNGSMLFNPQTDRQDAKCFAAVATQMDMKFPDAVRTEHLHNVALKGMAKTSTRNTVSEESVTRLQSLIKESGLIEIELPDYKGQMHKLSDEKGKVVLLDFTAYKTNYTANYNLMLRTLYNKYAEQGLSIYQVSLDNDESFWMNTASNLPWVCVRDEAGRYSTYLTLYNVRQLPTVFLIDRDGNIVERPDDTMSLDSKIAALLK